jgi:alkylhydroperoxidase family enzyme
VLPWSSMPRLPYLTSSDLSECYRAPLERDVNLYKALAHSPALMDIVAEFGVNLRGMRVLDPCLRELAFLRTVYLRSAPYAFAHHVRIKSRPATSVRGREFTGPGRTRCRS